MRFDKLIFSLATNVFLFAIIVFNPEVAGAKTIKAVAGSGEEILARYHLNFNRKCKPFVPKILITREPAHGTLSIRKIKRKLVNPNSGYEHCEGRVMVGAGVYYRAKKGFTGRDTFKYKVLLGNTKELGFRAKIAVGR